MPYAEGTLKEEAPAPRSGNAQEPDLGNIRDRLIKGFAWSMISGGVVQVCQIVVGLVLVRLLSPRDYGLAAMVLMFGVLVQSFSDLSMGAALVQRSEITETDRSTVFWTSVALSVVLSLAGVACSRPLADFYGQPAVRPMFMAVSLSFLLTPFQTSQYYLMVREMRFRLINLRVAAGAVLGGAAGVTAAVLGAGAWAIIVQRTTGTAVGALMLWTCSAWRPRFVFSWRSLRELGGYGLNIVGWQILGFGRNNGDNVLVGRVLGPASLGAYGAAFNLTILPLWRLIIPLQDILFPAFSRWQDDHERLGKAWLRVLRMVAAALAPALFGLMIVAADFVDVVMGGKWRAAIPVFQLMALVSLAYCLAQLGQRVFGALDRTSFIFRFALVETPLTIGAFALGLRWGLEGVVICYAAVSVPLQVIYIALTARAIEVPLGAVCRTFSGVALATLVMIAVCVALRLSLLAAGVGAGPRLALVIMTGAIVYLIACLVLEPQVLREIKAMRVRRSGDRAVAMAT